MTSPEPSSREPIRRRPGERAGLDVGAVLAAARALVDSEGVESLTMRRLAVALGVKPNSLYSYYPSKTALLDGLLDAVLAEVHTPDPDVATWQQGLLMLFGSTRAVLLSHPGLVGAFLARPGRGPNAIRLGEATLELLRRGGIEGRRAVYALRALLIYSLGFVAFEAPRRSDPDPVARSESGEAAFAAASVSSPNIGRVVSDLARHPGDAEFEAGLGWLLVGIAGGSPGPPGRP